ncbi:MAG: universal stress protein [Rhodobacteraceae bacterium]|nr:MAG: universal stress protein [Paracoccaceae bacterium]
MGFRTILVHIAEDDAGRARVDAAARIAEANEGRLIGLATVAQPTPVLVEGSAAAAGIWAEQAAAYEARAQQAADAFVEAMRVRGVEAEARIAGGFEENAGGALALNARYADLSVIGGRDGAGSRALADALLDGALFDSGRPALALPAKGAGETIGARPLLAWDGGSQAARAAREALPFLKAASHVRVCVAKTYFGMARHGEEPGADVARWLAAHGCKVAVEVVEPESRSVAEALTEAARRDGCDMIVMGAFGHSRLRESIFGGVTTELVDAPPLPLLLAH